MLAAIAAITALGTTCRHHRTHPKMKGSDIGRCRSRVRGCIRERSSAFVCVRPSLPRRSPERRDRPNPQMTYIDMRLSSQQRSCERSSAFLCVRRAAGGSRSGPRHVRFGRVRALLGSVALLVQTCGTRNTPERPNRTQANTPPPKHRHSDPSQGTNAAPPRDSFGRSERSLSQSERTPNDKANSPITPPTEQHPHPRPQGAFRGGHRRPGCWGSDVDALPAGWWWSPRRRRVRAVERSLRRLCFKGCPLERSRHALATSAARPEQRPSSDRARRAGSARGAFVCVRLWFLACGCGSILFQTTQRGVSQ